MPDSLLKLVSPDGVFAAVAESSALREMARRFIPADNPAQLLPLITDLQWKGLVVSVVCLQDEQEVTETVAAAMVDDHLELLRVLSEGEAADGSDITIRLSTLGLRPDGGEEMALRHAERICAAAQAAGVTVTIASEEHSMTERAHRVHGALRAQVPSVALTVASRLRRSVDDCRALAASGARVRLCKGSYDDPRSVSFTRAHDIDLSFVRCLRLLMEGRGRPMVATHDPRLVRITQQLACTSGRANHDFQLEMMYGVRPWEQRRLVDIGNLVRIYIPCGSDWYEYYLYRVSDRPANGLLVVRALLSRR